MNARVMKQLALAGLWTAAATLGLATSAQARDGLNWSVGLSAPGAAVSVSNMPAVVVPAPVMVPAAVVVPARPVYMAAPMVVQAPAYVVESKEHHRGKGWHKGHGRHASGRSDFWEYSASAAPMSAVVVQSAPHVWVR